MNAPPPPPKKKKLVKKQTYSNQGLGLGLTGMGWWFPKRLELAGARWPSCFSFCFFGFGLRTPPLPPFPPKRQRNGMDGVKCYSIYPSKVQTNPEDDEARRHLVRFLLSGKICVASGSPFFPPGRFHGVCPEPSSPQP